jgi:hypothetical protein
VHEGLRALSPRCRRLLTALFLDDAPRDYRQLARDEGISIGSVGPLRGRCLDQLRTYFAEKGWLE